MEKYENINFGKFANSIFIFSIQLNKNESALMLIVYFYRNETYIIF